jgi:hypothetical protein
MFGRRPRDPKPKLPDLDPDVTSHWNRGQPPNPPPPVEESGLDIVPTWPLSSRDTERRRGRRRLLVSCLIGLILGPIFLAVAIYLIHLFNPYPISNTLGERMGFGAKDEEEIFYTDEISEQQVKRLGAYLQRVGYFNELSAKSVRLSKKGEAYVVGFALIWGSWKKEDVLEDFRTLRMGISREVFDGSPVQVDLCARQPESKGKPMPAMVVLHAEEE